MKGYYGTRSQERRPARKGETMEVDHRNDVDDDNH